jgi:DNA-binding response OmpR family regulator
MKALIIEDNEDERDMICAFLQRIGFKYVVERSTLKAAVETLQKEKFDLITLDLRLSDSTPESTMASFPVIASYAGRTPVVVITGNPSFITECIGKNAQGLLRKPYHFRDFEEAVQGAMRCHNYRPLFPVAMLMLSSFKRQVA